MVYICVGSVWNYNEVTNNTIESAARYKNYIVMICLRR